MNKLLVELFAASSLDYEEAAILAKYLANNGVVVQKHGRWEKQADGTHFCSSCGFDAPYTYKGDEFTPSFCYHCGSVMDLARDEI